MDDKRETTNLVEQTNSFSLPLLLENDDPPNAYNDQPTLHLYQPNSSTLCRPSDIDEGLEEIGREKVER